MDGSHEARGLCESSEERGPLGEEARNEQIALMQRQPIRSMRGGHIAYIATELGAGV
jgi:hypothetical protein